MNLGDFGSWGLKQGSVANPAPNNKYKGQCVSLIQQYLYKVFGKSFKAYGNAKDWANNYPKSYFTKLSKSTKLQPGDVLVYGKNYGGGYGHIGLIDARNKWYDQNGVKKKAIGYKDKPFSGYVCVLRPKNQDKLGLNEYKLGSTYTLVANVNVRTSAKVDGDRNRKKVKDLTADGRKHATSKDNNDYAVLKDGTKVTVQEVKKSDGDTWIKIPSGWIAAKYNGDVYLK